MADHSTEEAHGDHEHGAHSIKAYVRTYVALLVLMFLSLLGSEVGAYTGVFLITFVFAFGIAFVKAGLVIRNFMHLTDEKPVAWYILITCLVFMGLFFGGVAADVMNHHGSNWTNEAAQNEVARVLQLADEGYFDNEHHGEAAEHPKADEAHGAEAGH